MTISQSIVLVLVIALWSTGNNVDLANNTTLLIILLVALISLSYATRLSQRRCYNNFQTTSSNLLTGLTDLTNTFF